MKKVILLLIGAAFIASCSTKPEYKITATIEGSDSISFMLLQRVSGKMVTIDSAVSKNGTFKMSGTVDYPDMVQLTAVNSPARLTFFLENSSIKITGNIDSLAVAKVSGSVSQDEYNGLLESIKPLSERYSALYNEYQVAVQEKNEVRVAELEKEAEAIQSEMEDVQKDFVKNNPSSFVSPTILRSLSYQMEATEMEEIISKMDTAVANTPLIQELMTRIQTMKVVSIGQKAPDFTMNDVNGQPVTLSSMFGKKKLLLVDFWAAWCNPCRQENPNVVKVWKEFNKKGFDVYGVSLDRTKEDWLKAIEDDDLTWTHVSDLQYWSNAAARLYAVNSIPANFLLDENGVIIARNLRGDALYDKVKELLGE